ncbi:MAG TPA: 2-succinyl-5-enolpyruvyl-6-hydroxy-3-cyclohexene-1-carboxylic-acid synthase [Actinomycetota bacterium]|jgi:2-succinyl-5-enolpyruvyl-6-hydroxy-3-cyclohexene-1-carboxylate synthase|nr:2-succinyl-5-enolpyruvyl-6-hydroxy-3-cyclohexene-1-carboxylic-acid synthase [Actinomycetota bacterium]
MSLGEVNLECAWALVDELVRGGMVHACVSPGSRSAPIALALERHPAVKTHVHLDERSSAFFALGIAKATSRPVGVACTSGTAAAELFPAVVEAWQARVPLILLTADRPARLRFTGANQTIDQIRLYGNYTHAYLEPPLPAPDHVPLGAWRKAGEAATRAVFGGSEEELPVRPPGPVQVNCSFDEPLVPDEAWQAPHDPTEPGDLLRGYTLPTIYYPEFVALVTGVERGVVVIGSLPNRADDALFLAERLGWPVLAEPTSNLRLPDRALAAGQGLISNTEWTVSMTPDVVVQFGAAPTRRVTQRMIASSKLVVVDSHHPDPDTEHRAAVRVRPWRPGIGRELADDLPPSPGETEWFAAWRAADLAGRNAMDAIMSSWDEPFEGRVARDLAAAIPDGGTLVVGSSMPIRDLDSFMAPRAGLRVLANRGASGIDGFVSTALGVAAAGTPTYALCGDLTFLHDVGALFWNARRGLDAIIVVLNNGGGTIFGFLPQRALPEFERLFETPHGLDLGAICAAAGAGHTRVERAAELISAVGSAAAAGGVHVVEVLIDAELDRARHGDVQAAVDEALRPLV